jgi:hypothetical protein
MPKGYFSEKIRRQIGERSAQFDGSQRCECARKRCPHPTDGAPASLLPKAFGDGLRCTRTFQEAHHLNAVKGSFKHTFAGLSNGQALCVKCHQHVHYGSG